MNIDKTEQEQVFLVTARKWRPLKFKDIIGQEHISTTLKNALSGGRISHSYLFSGPRGVGKTTTARILARAVNCENPHDFEPCNECPSCRAILENRSLDVIEIDGASNNSVDDIRKLRENAKYPPASSKYKLYIIDDVHMLSTSAFNALLKTLEEPPPHLMFVFATTEQHKVPATILSRCQRFEFRRMEIRGIADHLKHIADKEGIQIDEESLIAIAQKADGSMRDGQSLFDQVIAFCGNKITYSEMSDALHLIDRDFFFRCSEAILQKNTAEAFAIAKVIAQKGYDAQEFLGGLLEHLRNLLTVNVTNTASLIDTSSEFHEKYLNEARRFTKAELLRLINITTAAEQSLRFSPQPRLRFELALAQLTSLDSTVEISELLEEIKQLKQGSGLTSKPTANYATSTATASNTPIPVPQQITADTLRQRMEISQSKSATSIPVNVPAVVRPAATQEQEKAVLGEISKEALEKGWKEFALKVAAEGNGLSFVFDKNNVTPAFENGEVYLFTKNETLIMSLQKIKTDLLNRLEDFFGARVGLKFSNELPKESFIQNEIHTSPDVQQPITENTIASIKSAPTSNSQGRALHPVEKMLIEKFGAIEKNY